MGAVAGPSIRVLRHGDEGLVVLLEGRWTLSRLKPLIRRLSEELERHAALSGVTWDCRGIEVLDSAGALMLWRAWRHQVPERLEIIDTSSSVSTGDSGTGRRCAAHRGTMARCRRQACCCWISWIILPISWS